MWGISVNLSSMEYFILLAKEQSFTRAAERLHITQQALSSHIAGVEQELGTKLLLRRIPLELTYAGQVFLRYALEIQRKLDAMEQEFSDIANNQSGVLRIGVSTTRGHAIMPLLIDQFQQSYPKVSIQLAERSNDQLRDSLEGGEIDLAIGNFPAAMPGMEVIDFYQEEVVLVLAQKLWEQVAGPVGPACSSQIEQGDLTPVRHWPFLQNPRQDIAGRIGSELLSKAGITPVLKAESYNIETLLELCARGVGACFCPENLMRMTLSPEQISRLKLFHFGGRTRYQIRFAYLKQSYHWKVLSNFIASSLQYVSAL